MPPKAKLPAPIDRPLSRAYMREFTGWSTAEPPGISDPTSLRIMENLLVNRDGSCRVRPGLRYLSYSQAPASPLPVPVVTPTVVGANHVNATSAGHVTSLPLPVGTAVGDLLVVGIITGAGTAGTCTDPRMTMVTTQALGPRTAGVWCGYADDLSALVIDIIGDGGAITQFAMASVTALRAPEGPLEWVPDTTQVTASSVSTTALLPAVSGVDQSGALAVFLSSSGFGGVYSLQDWSKAPLYTPVSELDNSYIEVDVAIATGATVATQTTPAVGGTWYAVMIGLQGDSSAAFGPAAAGVGSDRPFVGTHEAFYLNDGTKAYLCAVREVDETVGFRVLVVDVNGAAMYALDHPLIDFEIRQTDEVLNFTAGTRYVKYLQIDNKIFALSDNGEAMRIFTVGVRKEAKALISITRPEWAVEDKLTVVHPDAAWINDGEPTSVRWNLVRNPSFETNEKFWDTNVHTKKTRPQGALPVPFAGERVLRLETLPERTNLALQPLHNVALHGLAGWNPGNGSSLLADGAYIKLVMPATKGTYYAHSGLIPGIKGGERYQVAYDTDQGLHVTPRCRIRFYANNGVQVGADVEREVDTSPRWIGSGILAPEGAVSARIYIGGENAQNDATNVRAKNVMLCLADESTTMFYGGTGANYFWTGTVNNSASVYHPPQTLTLFTDKIPVAPGKALAASLYVQAATTVRNVTLALRLFNKNGVLQSTVSSAAAPDVVGSMTRFEAGTAATAANETKAELRVTIPAVVRGEYHYVDAAMLESLVSVADTYFDGATTDTGTVRQAWFGVEHEAPSYRQVFTTGTTIPPAETRTTDTLVATGGPAVNTYSFGFFYTFNNEVGESAASKITVRRAQRPWSGWIWETPNVAGEPSGTDTSNPARCADQLVAYMPEDVYDEALAQGAISWSLYMFTWSEQDAAPVSALKVGTKELPADGDYATRGWIRVTPAASEAGDLALLPSEANRYNYSDPSRGGQGLVAADRMILVNDPTDAAVIRWSSNRQGEYTNFTASKGGGYKTLTSGNLFVPACVKLWQNPQSADTLTILCLGTDGHSTAYYMAPAQVASQSDAVNIMAFEETTATPGTTSPYGVEVFNNSLYHPVDDQLMKSTASNYNINHKSQTDLIRNMWEKLAAKEWIISSLHDSSLFYIVHNPDGATLEEGCHGNEIWVFDGASKTGTWSRYLIQATSLRKIEFGGRVYMSVIRPDGIYYLDPAYGLDDVVGVDAVIGNQAIPWVFETNTQGANRAHDAWAHLQTVTLSLGYFQGRMRYGLRGVDIYGKNIDISKLVRDDAEPTLLSFDVEDHLQVRRDLKEWFFYAESVTDDLGVVEPSYGQVNLVQYRYTPSSVNIGYELGSVETFQYGRDVAGSATSTTDNGIPLPVSDSRRP